MAQRKKTATKKTEKRSDKNQTVSDRLQNLNITKSYTSLAYGVITVVVLFILAVVAIRTFTQQEDVDIAENGVVTETESETYTVQSGETLWDISEQFYDTGFEWERIADANNLENPSDIEEGMELTIPEDDTLAQENQDTDEAQEEEETQEEEDAMQEDEETPATEEEPQDTPTPQQDEEEEPGVGGAEEGIEGDTYTVQEGDFLWDIAVSAYGDGYRWVEIYRANQDQIQNPDLIYVGQEFTIPRGE